MRSEPFAATGANTFLGSLLGSLLGSPWLIGTGLAMLAFAIFWPCLDGGLIWDDTQFITENELNRDPLGLWKIWCSFNAADYWPLTYTAFWAEWRLFGEAPRGYHIVNVLLHAITGLLVWGVLEQLSIRHALITALIFLAHPLNVECVAWIAQQKSLLATALMFASALAYLHRDSGSNDVREGRSAAWYAVALCLFVAALAAKTSVVTFPLALLGYEWLWRGAERRRLLATLPFFAVAFLFGLLTVLCNLHHDTSSVHSHGLAERLVRSSWALWFYLWKAVWPLDLCFVYPKWRVDPWALTSWLPAVLLLGILAAAWHWRGSWGRPVLAGLGWFLLLILPASGLIDIYFLSFSPVADHYAYQSLPGLLALVVSAAAWAIDRLAAIGVRYSSNSVIVSLIAVPLIAGLAWLSRDMSRCYLDEKTIWRDTIAKNLDCEVAYNNLGVLYRKEEDDERALGCFREVVRIQGQVTATARGLANYRGLLALMHYRRGLLVEAAAELDGLGSSEVYRGGRLEPKGRAGLLNLRGKVAELLGTAPPAAIFYRESLRVLPAENPEAAGFVLLDEVRGRAATVGDAQTYAALSDVTARYPETLAASRAHHDAGRLMMRADRPSIAVAHFRKAIELEPRANDSRAQLAVALQAAVPESDEAKPR